MTQLDRIWNGWRSQYVNEAGALVVGAAGSVFDLLASPVHNHRVEVTEGVLADAASRMLSNYFRRKRGKAEL